MCLRNIYSFIHRHSTHKMSLRDKNIRLSLLLSSVFQQNTLWVMNSRRLSAAFHRNVLCLALNNCYRTKCSSETSSLFHRHSTHKMSLRDKNIRLSLLLSSVFQPNTLWVMNSRRLSAAFHLNALCLALNNCYLSKCSSVTSIHLFIVILPTRCPSGTIHLSFITVVTVFQRNTSWVDNPR